MPVEVFESFPKLEARFKDQAFLQTQPARKGAIVEYLSRKGVLQIDLAQTEGWPKLVYPSRDKIKTKLTELETEYVKQRQKKNSWQWTHFRAKSHKTFSHMKKVVDPLYWQHVTKSLTDKEYREDSKLIDLHSHLVSDEKYRPMIKAFVHNEDYRKQLAETVKTSIVYKDHKGLGKHSQDKQALQLQVSQSLLSKAHTSMTELKAQIHVYKELLKWSDENP